MSLDFVIRPENRIESSNKTHFEIWTLLAGSKAKSDEVTDAWSVHIMSPRLLANKARWEMRRQNVGDNITRDNNARDNNAETTLRRQNIGDTLRRRH